MLIRPRDSKPTDPAAPPPDAAALAARRRRIGRWALVLLSLLGAAVLGETVLRVFFPSRLPVIEDERHLLYRYDATLGWFPVANTQARVRASRPFSVVHNQEGFRGPDRIASDKPVILFLGDSFVWGYDAEAEERFTEKLQAKHPEWSIYNMGVSGYGTDQEYLLLNQYFDTYKPRVVFLIFCTNTDDMDNCTNVRYDGYYKPYCIVTQTNRLQLKGVPVPRSERAWAAEHPLLTESYLARLFARCYFKLTGPAAVVNPSPTGAIIRDMQKYVTGKGAVLLVGLTEPNPPLQQFLEFFKIPYVDLSTELRYPGYGNHWTPEGHTFVCDKLEQFLRTNSGLGSPVSP